MIFDLNQSMFGGPGVLDLGRPGISFVRGRSGGGGGASTYTAKSVILDIADNWGGAPSIRSVDFWLAGNKIEILEADITGYATTDSGTSFAPWRTFDTSLSKTGVLKNNQWYPIDNASQRLIVVFDTTIEFDEIRINNGHYNGSPSAGAKNVEIHISDDTITNTTYNSAIPSSRLIFDGTFDQHSAVDEEDEQIIEINDPGEYVPDYTAKSVILDIADNWGGSGYIGIRSIEFTRNSKFYSTLSSDFSSYATSFYRSSNIPDYAFDTSLGKVGSGSSQCWFSNLITNNQRLIIVFDTAINFDEIIINNFHYNGTDTASGAKNVKIYTSTDAITSTVYDSAITNSTKIFDGVFDQHSAVDEEDPQTLELI